MIFGIGWEKSILPTEHRRRIVAEEFDILSPGREGYQQTRKAVTFYCLLFEELDGYGG